MHRAVEGKQLWAEFKRRQQTEYPRFENHEAWGQPICE
jgi:hypothetical protein